jgi:hypothetical protein
MCRTPSFIAREPKLENQDARREQQANPVRNNERPPLDEHPVESPEREGSHCHEIHAARNPFGILFPQQFEQLRNKADAGKRAGSQPKQFDPRHYSKRCGPRCAELPCFVVDARSPPRPRALNASSMKPRRWFAGSRSVPGEDLAPTSPSRMRSKFIYSGGSNAATRGTTGRPSESSASENVGTELVVPCGLSKATRQSQTWLSPLKREDRIEYWPRRSGPGE